MRIAVFVSAIFLACATPQTSSTMTVTARALPVDTERIRIADAVQWTHARHLMADLNGDGTQEHITIAADVTFGSNRQPIWEHGHRWAVIVEEHDQRTLVYGAFVPNGHVELAVLEPAERGARNLLVVGRTPHGLQTYVVAYDAPGRARSIAGESYTVERWGQSLVTR